MKAERYAIFRVFAVAAMVTAILSLLLAIDDRQFTRCGGCSAARRAGAAFGQEPGGNPGFSPTDRMRSAICRFPRFAK